MYWFSGQTFSDLTRKKPPFTTTIDSGNCLKSSMLISTSTTTTMHWLALVAITKPARCTRFVVQKESQQKVVANFLFNDHTRKWQSKRTLVEFSKTDFNSQTACNENKNFSLQGFQSLVCLVAARLTKCAPTFAAVETESYGIVENVSAKADSTTETWFSL